MQGFKLGQFLVEPKKGVISTEEGSTNIEPKAMAVLCELYANQGQVVSQQTLFDAVWPGRVFSPSSLQRIIAILRKALNENSQDPVFLFTHPKLGYRLEVPQQESITPEPNKRRLPFVGLVGAFFLLLSISIYLFSPTPLPQIKKTIVTHSDAGEFNSRFSGDEYWISYQSQSHPNDLFVVELNNPSSTNRLFLPDEVIDHHWRNRTILVLTRDSLNNYSLLQIKDILNPAPNELVTLNNFEHVDEIQIDSKGNLWFIGREIQKAFGLYHYDVLAGKTSNLKNLGNEVISASLATSEHGLYYHYFDGKKDNLGLMSDNGNSKAINVILPHITSIAWHSQSQSLIVSDQLNPKQYLLRDSSLLPFPLDEKNVLGDIAVTKNTLSATIRRQDMDIVKWQYSNGQLVENQAVDSKYEDYQAIRNRKSELAYLSTRFGHPQVMFQSSGATKVLYTNSKKIPFIPPMIWSPDSKSLALILSGEIILIDKATGNQHKLKGIDDAERLFQWPQGGLIYFSKAGKVVQLTNDTRLPLGNDKDLVFLGSDSSNRIFGVSSNTLFWGQKSRKLKLKEKEQVRFAFSYGDHLVLHIADDTEITQLKVLDSELKVIYEFELGAGCRHLSDLQIHTADLSWLCTDIQPSDDDIVLFEGMTLN